jgi:hypothetical protein
MSAILEVKYFNSFQLKKTHTGDPTSADPPVWDGSTGVPGGANPLNGSYPQTTRPVSSDAQDVSWVIEESRIRGGYNNTNIDYGVRAYLVDEEPNGSTRSNALIYSGIFNSRTGINNTNVFNVAEDITKAADPANGSIQKLYAEDTNLIIFQENKISRALIDKDAIYTAEGGGTPVSQFNLVIGQIIPYAGNFGISTNPESFAVYGYRKYFVDKNRNAVMRLSQDGLTEISNYGMVDYFRDELSNLSISDKVVGAWDIYTKQYVVSLQGNNITPTTVGNDRGVWVSGGDYKKDDTVTYSSEVYVCISDISGSTITPNNDTSNWFIISNTYQTLTFDESVLGWTSRFTYKPEQAFSLKARFYSINNGTLYQHNYQEVGNNDNRSKFYNVYSDSNITFIFNPNVSASKVFKTINYEGSSGWEVSSFESARSFEKNDIANFVYSYDEGGYMQNGIQYYSGFYKKEGKYFANLVNNSPATDQEIVYGASISGVKGYYSTVTIRTDDSTQVVGNGGKTRELFAVSSEYVESSY